MMASLTNATMRRVVTKSLSSLRPSLLRASIVPAISRPFSNETSDSLPPPPPLLSKLKTDLKTAMRAKDAPRLSVLRNIISATNNAAKTTSPIRTDAQLVALMRKTARGNHEAADEARKAGRADLVDKEEAQLRVIDEYVAGSGVRVLDEAELRELVEAVVSEGKAGGKKQGEVMKELQKRDWDGEGKYVDKSSLAKIFNEIWAKN
ncbi:hypothetical protein BD289DRAFT_479038 [Coniella lustricola]|uniref:Altered inheritance of mitochondria protein 41 n=1 Tax=Coniella lustricola TaxID=2025994 RepID=A0A2T3AKD8_9PEZI|nr:hypothetical protein BD289DRAFT_479038 [Coniella lustricola]